MMLATFVIIAIICMVWQANAFVIPSRLVSTSVQRKADLLSDSTSLLPTADDVRKRIESIISDNKVVLFMKGTRVVPQCGFSSKACKILDAARTTYETVDVLEDDSIRNGIKEFSKWPTIPQLYINKEFVGGSDIMWEMYESGELAEVLKK